MKYLFILFFIPWNALGLDCDLTFDNKAPSRILEHLEAINLMDEKTAVLCFNELKSFLITDSLDTNVFDENNASKDDIPYENSQDQEGNIERVQYLMSLLMDNQNDTQSITPRPHSELTSQNMFLIKTTLTQIKQTQSIAGKPIFSEEIFSALNKQVKKIQPQKRMSTLWNPYLNFPLIFPQRDDTLLDPPPDPDVPVHTELDTEIVSFRITAEQKPQQPVEQNYLWKETIHIEFPSILECRNPVDEISQTLTTVLKNYENTLIDFTDSHTDIEHIYTNIMEWIDSIRNPEEQKLQHTHPLFNFTSYNTSFNQIPDFILNSMTLEQKENLAQVINLSRRYAWMYNLHFEYRKCLPKLFREHISISYSAPSPLLLKAEAHSHLSDIELLYELSAHTAPFAASFKQSYPINVFRQSYIDWDDFTASSVKNRYGPEWNNTLQFLRHFILQNRTYLDVSL